MVTEYGMSERVGAIKLGQSQGEVFLGRDMGHQRDYSEEIAGVVDEEVRRLIDAAHDEAWHVVNDNRAILDQLVLELLEKETLNAAELAEIFAPVKKRPKRPTWLSSETRLLSDQPPVLTPAERAAANGGAESADGAPATAHAIDKAAEAGAYPRHEEHPRPRSSRSPKAVMSTQTRTEPEGDAAGARNAIDFERAEAAVRELLIAVGEDPDRDGLKETPARVARAYAETFAGLRMSPEEVLSATFPIEHDEMILVRDIEVYSTCEHHLVPFHGVAHVAYIPAKDGRVTGLSKIARLVEVFARRPQVQAAHHPGGRCARRPPPRPGRHGRRRGGAPVHVDARGAQAGLADHHLRGAGQLRDAATRAEAMALLLGGKR